MYLRDSRVAKWTQEQVQVKHIVENYNTDPAMEKESEIPGEVDTGGSQIKFWARLGSRQSKCVGAIPPNSALVHSDH